jgi:hypothetical protein
VATQTSGPGKEPWVPAPKGESQRSSGWPGAAKNSNRSIFRADALRRYTQRQEQPVLPQFGSPYTLAYLWVLLALVLGSGSLAWFVRLPAYNSGSAVVIDRNRQDQGDGEVVAVAFFPPENLPLLQVGQMMFLGLDATGQRLGRTVIAVEPEILSPAAARQRFGFSAGTALPLTQPAAVAIARLEPLPPGLPARSYLGSVYPVAVEAGSRRVVSLMPIIGQWFGDSR